ncbi:hypothetical protein [uncultured Winogradskyella sp.]|uniref:TolB family protein n=1 Tax=uncultured Winogradskyella sp. TaxID=395353 RepID=UPI00262A81DD|nr:hypothetical protein [uncultured Winogradskyella sp.]
MKKLFLACTISFFSIQTALGQKIIEKPNIDSLKIAFVSYKTGTAEIYLMNTDGSDVEQITSSKEDNSFPYQIDQRTIGFTRTDATKTMQKFKIDIVTKKEEPIIEPPTVENAKWEVSSKNGRYIAFVKSKDYSDRELYIYDTHSQKEIKVSDKTKEEYKALSVGFSWSKNGKYMIFMSGPDWFNQFIRLYDVENNKVSVITNRGYMNSGIQWLNDNKTLIANLKIRGKKPYELYSINISDGELVQLTEGINLHPDVSPDGEWVVFESQRHNNYGEAYIMKTDGSNQIRLTNNSDYNGRCTWFKL